MSRESEPPLDDHFTVQAVGGYVGYEKAQRALDLARNLDVLERAYTNASEQLSQVRDFVNLPGGILGNASTKHGEIAEHVEVAVRNARDFMAHRLPSAVIDEVPRIGPTDYLVNGEEVQSKFINGARNTLRHVLDHLQKYPQFGEEGRCYHIPKDQHEQILRVLSGAEGELSGKAQRALREGVREFESLTGKPFQEAVRPSLSKYAEVQQGKIHSTLAGHQADVDHSRDVQESTQRADAGPSLQGVAGAALAGAAVGATVQVLGGVITKVREGKNPLRGEFTVEDWRELGLKGLEGGAKGGVAAAALYGLTNYADMAAPFAGAFVSSAIAVQELHGRYRRGEIEFDEFVGLGELACAEGAVVGLATALGQVAIPVPVLGAVLGAAAGRLLTAVARKVIAEDEARIQRELKENFDSQIARLDQAARLEVARLMAAYDQLGDLTLVAFDVGLNTQLRLRASVQLAEEYGVPSGDILHDTDELDAFMAGRGGR